MERYAKKRKQEKPPAFGIRLNVAGGDARIGKVHDALRTLFAKQDSLQEAKTDCRALWSPSNTFAVVVESRGKIMHTFGIMKGPYRVLELEEALYLMERGTLSVEDTSQRQWPIRHMYAALPVPLSAYIVFSRLRRAGYHLQRPRALSTIMPLDPNHVHDYVQHRASASAGSSSPVSPNFAGATEMASSSSFPPDSSSACAASPSDSCPTSASDRPRTEATEVPQSDSPAACSEHTALASPAPSDGATQCMMEEVDERGNKPMWLDSMCRVQVDGEYRWQVNSADAPSEIHVLDPDASVNPTKLHEWADVTCPAQCRRRLCYVYQRSDRKSWPMHKQRLRPHVFKGVRISLENLPMFSVECLHTETGWVLGCLLFGGM